MRVPTAERRRFRIRGWVIALAVVILVNLVMSVVVLPRLDTSFLAEEKWGGTTLAAVGGVWAVVVALPPS